MNIINHLVILTDKEQEAVINALYHYYWTFYNTKEEITEEERKDEDKFLKIVSKEYSGDFVDKLMTKIATSN